MGTHQSDALCSASSGASLAMLLKNLQGKTLASSFNLRSRVPNGTRLENRKSNITTQLSHIFKAFSDFRLVAQIREEIEKVKMFEQIVII